MAAIIIGTTPTIQYTFKTVSVEYITKAFLTVKKKGAIILKKELADATVGEDTISWRLTQSDTLAIGTDGARIMCNWLTTDGTRGASAETEIRTKDNHLAEVI